MSKFMQYAMAASAEALKDSGWLPKNDRDQEMTVSRASNAIYQPTQLMRSRAYAWAQVSAALKKSITHLLPMIKV